MEQQIEHGSKYIITCDYDTIFTASDVIELYRLMESLPNADAICALQSKRGNSQHALFGIHGVEYTPAYNFERHIFPVSTGHFGLTIFRMESLKSLPKPWMNSKPNDSGVWDDGKIDADIDFWNNWRGAGKTLFLAPRVIVGHLQEVITWPDKEMKPIHQSTGDYDKGGMPPEILR